MTQRARPLSDVSRSGWTPTPLSPQLNEFPFDDLSLVTTASAPQAASFEVKLKGIALPSPGIQRLRLRLRTTGGPPVQTTMILFQAARAIAATTVEPGAAFSEYMMTLTDDEAAQITDYTDLRVRVVAGRLTTDCCPAGLPLVLRGQISNRTGVFTILPSSILLICDPTSLSGLMWYWEAPAPPGQPTGNLELICVGHGCAGMRLSSGAYILASFQFPDTSPPCSEGPFQLVYTVSGTFGLGTGGYTLKVTE